MFTEQLLQGLDARIIMLITFILCVVIGVSLTWLGYKVFFHYTIARDGLIKKIFEKLKTPLYFLTPLIILRMALPHNEFYNELTILNVILRIATVLVISWTALRIINTINAWFEKKYNIYTVNLDKEKRIITKFYFLKKVSIILIFVTATSLILLNFENFREVGKWLLTSAGLIGAILVFTAQKSLANIMFGLQLAFTESLKIGDSVVIENEFGTVEEINLTHVVVRLWDLRRLILPLSYFNEKPFQNWTHTSSDLLGTVFIYTDYNIDVEELKIELAQLLVLTPLWNKKIGILQISDLKENSIELRVLASAQNATDLWNLRCYIREKLIYFIQKHYPNSLPKVHTRVTFERNR